KSPKDLLSGPGTWHGSKRLGAPGRRGTHQATLRGEAKGRLCRKAGQSVTGCPRRVIECRVPMEPGPARALGETVAEYAYEAVLEDPWICTCRPGTKVTARSSKSAAKSTSTPPRSCGSSWWTW